MHDTVTKLHLIIPATTKIGCCRFHNCWRKRSCKHIPLPWQCRLEILPGSPDVNFMKLFFLRHRRCRDARFVATTFSITTQRLKGLFATLSIRDPQNNGTQHNNTRYWVPLLSLIMLGVVMLSV